MKSPLTSKIWSPTNFLETSLIYALLVLSTTYLTLSKLDLGNSNLTTLSMSWMDSVATLMFTPEDQILLEFFQELMKKLMKNGSVTKLDMPLMVSANKDYTFLFLERRTVPSKN